jgi:hypothetical protein
VQGNAAAFLCPSQTYSCNPHCCDDPNCPDVPGCDPYCSCDPVCPPPQTYSCTLSSPTSFAAIYGQYIRDKIEVIDVMDIFTGNGEDGSITINTVKNLNADIIASGRSYPDGVNWQITNSVASGQSTISSGISRPDGFAVGDEIIIINLKGTSTDYSGVGLYELKTITALPYSDSITVDSNLTGSYDGTTQKIIVQRVPHYTDVTINSGGLLTCSAFDGNKGGVVAFRANGIVTVNVDKGIDASGKGFPGGIGVGFTQNSGGGETYNGTGGAGGSAGASGYSGLSGQGGGGGAGSYCGGPVCVYGSGATGSTGGGGGGGGAFYSIPGSGGGGSYSSFGSGGDGGGDAGENGTIGNGTIGGSGGNSSSHGSGGGGGGIYGISDLLSRLYFGSGGGAGGTAHYINDRIGGNGGNGGGIVYISANTININTTGSIKSNGNNGANGSGNIDASSAGGGGGAGGSIAIFAYQLNNSGNINTNGGIGGLRLTCSYGSGCSYTPPQGGTGGNGRTYAAYYSFSGNDPTPSFSGRQVDPTGTVDPVKFYGDEGANSFADGSSYNSICEMCHTMTNHFRNAPGASDQNHTNLGDDIAGTNCMTCHTHDSGFYEAAATCIDCHSVSQGGRAAIKSQFSANSHHIQEGDIECLSCYEGTGEDGALNLTTSGGCYATGMSWDGTNKICTINTDTKSVFNFTSINIASGVTLTATGSNYLTLYSGNVAVNGTITLNGSTGGGNHGPGGAGGAGGYAGGAGGHPGANGSGPGYGSGGMRGSGASHYGDGGGSGGPTYTTANIGGSGGGGGGGGSDGIYGAGGGGGGGSLIIDSAGDILINSGGFIVANGGSGGNPGSYGGGGGGGSGGLINLIAKTVTNSGTISASGGAGGPGGAYGGPGYGAGGGGVLIQTNSGTLIGNAPLVTGGTGGGGNGTAGSVIYSFRPDPSGTYTFNSDLNIECYQCHWEANADGSINSTYHEGYNPDVHSFTSGAKVDLVIYGTGARPTTYTEGTTAVQYTADGTRSEIKKINTHCLGCHSAKNNTATPFVDGKTPKWYAWDGKSIDERYSQTGTTPWGKYSGGRFTPKNTQTKAYSAHGNAINNQGGWNLSETWPNTRNGSEIVACFDCHNSHGSTASGTTTSYTSATTNGGILKDTVAGKGGYTIAYKPQAGGSTANKNVYNSGAGICFDCHLNGSSGTTPWGYNTTFGETQAIMGYFDPPYFGSGSTGPKQRFSYKATPHRGGHFGASSTLSSTPSQNINGLCTSCHDPHGVSPTLGTNMQYGVPLLKGTWLTSLYHEDWAPANDAPGTIRTDRGREGVHYYIDQNTFGSDINATVTGITQTDNQFAGLCLNCHPKNSLTNGTTHTWKSEDRVHESVKGWKTADATIEHNYPCSKCHIPHSSSLPRLMVTDCLDHKHKGLKSNNTSAKISATGSGSGFNFNPIIECIGSLGDGCPPIGYHSWNCSVVLGWCPEGEHAPEGHSCRSGGSGGGSSGSGRKPGNWVSGVCGAPSPSHTVTCHESYDSNQYWNTKTPWTQ